MRGVQAIVLVALLAVGCSKPEAAAPELTACGLPSDRLAEFITVPAGSFVKGEHPVYPEEAPTVAVHVDAFRILSHEVTNDEFARFVADTGYVTDAEKSVSEGREGAGSAVFRPELGASGQYPWQLVSGATWQSPEGDESNLEDRGNHPVVHVSLRDAEAYAAWVGGRLPSEVEWEYAASLGLPEPQKPVSGAYGEDGTPRANTWQGIFPVANTAADGFTGTAPVGCFGADRIGLHDMIGNVWEWTDTPFAPGRNTIKGGSYLCASNFCHRYRPAARQPEEIDFSSNHIGFRIVKDAGESASD